MCGSCRLSIYQKKVLDNYNNSETEEVTSSDLNREDPTFEVHSKSKERISEPELVEIAMSRTVSTHKYCCICSLNDDLIVIPEEVRISTYIKTRIYIPSGNRCCRRHLIKNRIYEEVLRLLKVYSYRSTLTQLELSKLMKTLSLRCDSSLLMHVGEFSMPEEQIEVFTGFKWDNLIKIRDMLTSLRNTQSRSVIQALVIFLFKLRSGNSNKMTASIFQLDDEHYYF